MKRAWPSIAFALAALVLLLWLWPQSVEAPRLISTVRPTTSDQAVAATPTPPESSEAELTELNLAADLNAPGKTIRDDLKALDAVFSVWQTNFLHTGNPVGTNAEITASLTGHNTFHVAFVSPKNGAINRDGELCDRWGTPFFFHQLSGTKMEIRSAGPDRKRGTDDDSVLTP